MFNWLRDFSRRIVGNKLFLSILGLSLFYYLYVFKLGTIVSGLSQAEATSVANSSSLSTIWDNPIYAPHKLLQLGLREVFGYSPASVRMASVLFAGVFLLCVFVLCRRWFGQLIAVVATIILGALPWVSLLGRSATPSVMLLVGSLLLVTYYYFARSQKRIFRSWLIFCVSVGLALYTPGLAWILLAGIAINRRSLIFNTKRLSKLKLAAGVLLILLLISPLLWAFVRTPALLHHWLLIPVSWIGITAFAKNLGWALGSLFIRLPEHLEWTIGRLPVFTILISTLAVFGGYAMSLQARQKLYAIVALLFFGCLASAANGNYIYLTFCVIPMALLAAAGLRFLFLQWQAVFPRNPIPRYFAYGLIVLLAIGQFAFGARSTIYAWPHTSDTKAIFVLK